MLIAGNECDQGQDFAHHLVQQSLTLTGGMATFRRNYVGFQLSLDRNDKKDG